MSDQVSDNDASLPVWHAEEILPASGDAQSPPPPQTPAPAPATPKQKPPPAAASPVVIAPAAASRETATPPADGPAASTPVTAKPVVPASALATKPTAPPVPSAPSESDEKRSLVVVAAATATATTLVLLAIAAVGFFFWSRSDSTDVQTTPDDEAASPAISSDEVTDPDEADQAVEPASNGDTTADQPAESVDEAPETTEEAEPEATDQSDADAATPPANLRAGSAMAFVVAGVDELGRPVPELPRFLVGTTPNPDQLPNYHPDPGRVPEVGPYTVAKGGFFFLRGTVASENLRQELIRRMLLVTSRDSLIIEMVVDERDPWYLDRSVPLYLEDAIQFDVGEADLEIDVLRAFLRIAELVALSPEITLEITGHTDNIGSEESNLALSEQRVGQVEDAFTALGVPADQLVALALGEADPIASNETEAGRAINRRVEFAIVYPEPLDALE